MKINEILSYAHSNNIELTNTYFNLTAHHLETGYLARCFPNTF